MATDTDGAANGYLRRQLSDGTASFRYRGRIRTLLGHPESGSVESDYPTLPVAGFTQRRPQFTGDFEFPDDLLTIRPHRVANAAELSPFVRTEVGSPGEVEPARSVSRSSNAPGTPQVASQTGYWHHGATRRTVIAPGSTVLAPEQVAGVREPAPARTQPVPAPSHNGPERVDHPLKRHDIIVPGVHAPQRSAVADGETRPLEVEPVRRLEFDRTGLHSTVEQPRQKGTVETAGSTSSAIERVTLSPPPMQDAGGVRPIQVPPPPGTLHPISDRPLLKPRVAPEEMTDVAAQAESAVRRRMPKPRDRDPIPVVRSVPPRLRRHPLSSERGASRRSEAGPTASADAAVSHAPAAATAPQAPVIVVKQVAGAEPTPFAFWERRHLSRVRARVRR
jgi:hypothetical protein